MRGHMGYFLTFYIDVYYISCERFTCYFLEALAHRAKIAVDELYFH